jgi:hypothetical protein
MFNIENFQLKDPAPSVPLKDISPISSRALALLVRNQKQPILKTGFLNIYGATDMIDGLEHHCENFMRLIQQLINAPAFSTESRALENHLRHEIVAYLNRMGQFYYFVKSRFVTERISGAIELIPIISKFILLREKHTAHRSIDWPRKEDSVHHQQLQAWGLSSISSLTFSPKDKSKALANSQKIADPRIMWGENYLCLQMRGKGENEFINFSVEQEHPKISLEAFNLIEKLVMQAN